MTKPMAPAVVQVMLVAVVLIWAAQCMGSPTEAVDYLNVPASTFKATLTSTLSHVSKALSAASHYNVNGDFALLNAVKDCVDLLELSSLQLSWALSSLQTGKSNTTKDLGSDLNTWLNAVSTNQEACKEGLEDTSVDTSIANHVSKVSALAWRALDMVCISPELTRAPKGDTRKMPAVDDFPTWVSAEEKKLLLHAPDVVVALDGTGNFTRIREAVAAAGDDSEARFVIYVKKGVYHENVLIGKRKCNVMMYGDGIDATIVSGSRSVLDGWKTFNTATFGTGSPISCFYAVKLLSLILKNQITITGALICASAVVMGRGFIARDMTFENTAGPERHQAVAFRSHSDFSALYRCAFRGYQDTLYAHSCRQFYRECTIAGTVDFIFGDATAVFQDCLILAKLGLPNQKNTVTAQGRRNSSSASGFSIQHCNISADTDLVRAGSTYLGRPWKKYSRTVIMESYIGDHVSKEGWMEWKDYKYLSSLYYAEYRNSGPGADVGGRVHWPGYHVLRSSRQASMFTVSRFIHGDSWLPGTGVTYDQGLSVHP
ncbi:hypothetical protein V2J09_016217 [Rumex salicifolius]